MVFDQRDAASPLVMSSFRETFPVIDFYCKTYELSAPSFSKFDLRNIKVSRGKVSYMGEMSGVMAKS